MEKPELATVENNLCGKETPVRRTTVTRLRIEEAWARAVAMMVTRSGWILNIHQPCSQ